MLAAILIFAATYLVLAVGRIPFLRVDRTGAAIIGASLMLAFNVLTVQEAYAAINYDAIILLFGMMIVVANLRLSGFFAAVSAWVVDHAHAPLVLLSGIVLVAGVFSAFFVNDTMCLVLTPLVLDITRRLGRKPIPYLLAVAMSSNIGSVATITGNPQNMMIGSFSQIPYRTFAAALAPIAAVGLALTVAVIALVYRAEFRSRSAAPGGRHSPVRVNRPLLWKSLAVSAAMIVFFFAGWPVPKVAVIAGALLLITRRVKPEKVYREIDWSLLVLFIGLFIVIAGIEKTTAVRRPLRCRRPLPPRSHRAAEHLRRPALEPGEQCPGRPRLQSLHPPTRPSGARLAHPGHVLHPGRQSHAARFRRQSDRRAACPRRSGNLLLRIRRAGVPLTVLTLAAGVWMLN